MSLELRSTPANMLPQPSGTEVPWGEWRRGEGSDVLYTRGIEECIAVGVYDPRGHIGHLAHILARDASQDEIIPQLSASILEDCEGEVESLTICLAGGMLDDESTWQLTEGMKRRDRVETVFKDFGVTGERHIEWNDLFSPYDLELDCSTGLYRLTEVLPSPWKN